MKGNLFKKLETWLGATNCKTSYTGQGGRAPPRNQKKSKNVGPKKETFPASRCNENDLRVRARKVFSGFIPLLFLLKQMMI